jgi:hypothetical protein
MGPVWKQDAKGRIGKILWYSKDVVTRTEIPAIV